MPNHCLYWSNQGRTRTHTTVDFALVGLKIDFGTVCDEEHVMNVSRMPRDKDRDAWYWRNYIPSNDAIYFPGCTAIYVSLVLLLTHIFRFPLSKYMAKRFLHTLCDVSSSCSLSLVFRLCVSIKLLLDIASNNFSLNTSSSLSHFSFILSIAISHWVFFLLSNVSIFITNISRILQS